MVFVSFVDCYHDYKQTGKETMYLSLEGIIRFKYDKNCIIHFVEMQPTYDTALQRLIYVMIRDGNRDITILRAGHRLNKLHLDEPFYDYQFINVNGDAILVQQTTEQG